MGMGGDRGREGDGALSPGPWAQASPNHHPSPIESILNNTVGTPQTNSTVALHLSDYHPQDADKCPRGEHHDVLLAAGGLGLGPRTHPPNQNNAARKLKLNIVSVVSPVPSLVLLTFFLYEMFSTSLSVTEPLHADGRPPYARLHLAFPNIPRGRLKHCPCFPNPRKLYECLLVALPMLRGLSPNVSCNMSLCRYSLRPRS